jgi:hypothetical protein
VTGFVASPDESPITAPLLGVALANWIILRGGKPQYEGIWIDLDDKQSSEISVKPVPLDFALTDDSTYVATGEFEFDDEKGCGQIYRPREPVGEWTE